MKIHEMKFFEGIDNIVIDEIEKNCSKETFNPGETIFEKGDPANFLYFLDSGKIDLLLKEKQRNIFILSNPGDVFGWSSIVENGIYTSSSMSKGKTTILKISREAIKAIFNRHPKAAVIFYQRIGSVFSKRLSMIID